MSLAKALRQNFPQAVFGPPAPPTEWDIVLMDHSDGKGQFIHAWNEKKLGPQPKPAQLDALRAEYVPPPPPTVQERMADLGVSVADLKAALAEPAAAQAIAAPAKTMAKAARKAKRK